MPIRSPLWRAPTPLAVALVGLFGIAAVATAIGGAGPTAGVADAIASHSARTESSLTAPTAPLGTATPPTTPATTGAPALPPTPEPVPVPVPVPAPDPAPRAAPAPRAEPTVASQPPVIAAAPAPPAPPPVSSCQSLSAGGLISAHQSVHAFSADGGLSASAQAFALTLCGAHAEDRLFHSGQGAGENLAWIQSSGGCLNDGSLVVQTWLASPAHRANLDRFSVVGGGVACDGSNTYFVAQYR